MSATGSQPQTDRPTGTPVPGRQRDLRVDFWRGVAMFIIFMAHMPGNFWAWYIPARFGPSDGAEMFVFCSGFASAVAFGGTFMRSGWLVGCARVLHRVWQIYWAQIGLFLVMLAVCYIGSGLVEGKDYVGQLNLYPFVDDPARGVVHLLTMTYVPNLFDILPMYMVVLAMTPLVVLAHRTGGMPALAAFIGTVYIAAQFGLELPAEWWSDRPWFFNPFGWALLFFSGFAISAGWVRVPGPNIWLIGAALLFVAALVPVSHWPIWRQSETLTAIHDAMKFGFGIEKTGHGIIRYLHFMALAYLAHVALRDHAAKLEAAWLRPLIKVGQNALPVFLASLPLSYIGGMVLDVTGSGYGPVAAVNLGGFALLVGVAYGGNYFKKQPWKRPAGPRQDARSADAPADRRAPPAGGRDAMAAAE